MEAHAETCPICRRPIDEDVGDIIAIDGGDVVTRRGRARLRKLQMTLFELLLKRVGRCVAKESLYDWLYQLRTGDDLPHDKIIDVSLVSLRKSLKPIGLTITTHWGRGVALERDVS